VNDLALLSADYRRTNVREIRKIHRGLDAFAFSFRGRQKRGRHGLDHLRRQAGQVQERVTALSLLGKTELQEKIGEMRATLARHAHPEDELLREALALAATVSSHTLGMVPFDVQLLGALAIVRGYLAEMATGEGKTLTVALAAAVAGWGNRPVHVITANDYLAARDAEGLGSFYAQCGLTVGCVTGTMEPPERQRNYAATVTYTTAKEALADFLRDRIQIGNIGHPTRRLLRALAQKQPPGTGQFILRGLYWAIVDEADSVLIDEAVTPLIISQPVDNEALNRACKFTAEMASTLRPGIDYDLDLKYRDVHLRESALQRMAVQSGKLPPQWRTTTRQRELLRTALIARELYQRGIHYVIQDDKIELVDEFPD